MTCHRTGYGIFWVGVGWRRQCKTRQPLRALDSEGTVNLVCLFLAVAPAGGRPRSFVPVGQPYLAQGE